MADSVHRHGMAHVDRHATPHCSDQQVFVTSDGLPTMRPRNKVLLRIIMKPACVAGYFDVLRCNRFRYYGFPFLVRDPLFLQIKRFTQVHTEVNYLDPKDPVKVGKFSTTTTTRPVRVEMIVDPLVPHLKTNQRVAYLCFIRSLMWLVRTMETLKMPGGQRLIDHIEPGRFWVSDNTQDVVGRSFGAKSEYIGILDQETNGKGID